MTSANRQMTMVAFLQAQNCSNLPGSWRHPASMSDFLTPDYYQRIARILEDGKFHMAFLMIGWRCPTSMRMTSAIPWRMACAR